MHLLGRNGPFVYAFSGIEIALWDIRGKRAGQPLYAIVGWPPLHAACRLFEPAALRRTRAVAENARGRLRSGFQHIKLHEVTRENVLAASKAVATGPRIMLDVNCAWSVRGCV